MPDDNVTALLSRWREGDPSAAEALMPLVYQELHRLAKILFARENPGHTLQATAVVHEAFLRLAGVDIPWEDRAHFFSVAGRMMRRVLVDHARAARSAKRGGERQKVTLGTDPPDRALPVPDILDLDRVLLRLSGFDERKARIIEMHYFAGLTSEEIGAALGLAGPTVRGELRIARAWLRRELGGR